MAAIPDHNGSLSIRDAGLMKGIVDDLPFIDPRAVQFASGNAVEPGIKAKMLQDPFGKYGRLGGGKEYGASVRLQVR